nr:heavy metal-binding domain-containing protein [Methylosinus sp. Sm6]
MHPQIRQPQPGNCPICGMALEPVVTSAEMTERSTAVRAPAAFANSDERGCHRRTRAIPRACTPQ